MWTEEDNRGRDMVAVGAKEFFEVARDAIALVEKTQLEAIRRASVVLAERMRLGESCRCLAPDTPTMPSFRSRRSP
jgi:hypothetical protein